VLASYCDALTDHWQPVAPAGSRPTVMQRNLNTRERPIQDLQPMSDVAMAISTDADTDADVAYLDHLVTS